MVTQHRCGSWDRASESVLYLCVNVKRHSPTIVFLPRAALALVAHRPALCAALLPLSRYSRMESQDDFAAPVQGRRSLDRSHFAAAVAAVVDKDDGKYPPASNGFVAALTQVTWDWTTKALAPDLESFARHSKRAQVGPEDVLLAARKNETTRSMVAREFERIRPVKRQREQGGAVDG